MIRFAVLAVSSSPDQHSLANTERLELNRDSHTRKSIFECNRAQQESLKLCLSLSIFMSSVFDLVTSLPSIVKLLIVLHIAGAVYLVFLLRRQTGRTVQERLREFASKRVD
jgi:hypothetical protein